MKPYEKVFFLLSIFVLGVAMILVAGAHAQGEQPTCGDIVQGALLYDKWYAALDVDSPEHDNPLWSRQSTNTRSGPDTWRCVECHGWDYKGVEGAYGSGSHFTGFPNIKKLTEQMSQGNVLDHLRGGKDPAHDFSPYMSEDSLTALAAFLKCGFIDDDIYMDDISLQVIAGDIPQGQELYEQICIDCHGADGKTIIFRTEGIDEYLGTIANRDPWRFLHRTRFGTSGTPMPVGYTLGWTPEDGRDILAYAQTLPTGLEEAPQTSAGEQAQPTELFGGPARTFWQGILTGFAAFLGTIGASILFLSVLVIIGVVVVALLRRR